MAAAGCLPAPEDDQWEYIQIHFSPSEPVDGSLVEHFKTELKALDTLG